MSLFILRGTTLLLTPWILLYAIYLLGRGHQNVGGGFIAGVMIALGITLIYIALGPRIATKIIPIKPHYMISFGLLLALATGVFAMIMGVPFLTSTFGIFHLPFLGHIELASATLFDIAIFFAVAGSVLVIVVTIGTDD